MLWVKRIGSGERRSVARSYRYCCVSKRCCYGVRETSARTPPPAIDLKASPKSEANFKNQLLEETTEDKSSEIVCKTVEPKSEPKEAAQQNQDNWELVPARRGAGAHG